MSKPDWRPQEMPTLQVNWLSRLLSKHTDQQLAEVGLTVSQLPVLVALKNGDSRTQKELADLAGVTQPSMAQLLSRMEREGLVQRTPSRVDGRSSMISLTNLASSRLGPGRAVLRRLDDHICSILTDEERHLVTGILQKLIHRAEGSDVEL